MIIRITGIVRRRGFAAGTLAETGSRTAGASTACTVDFMIIVYSLDGAAGAARPPTPALTAGRPNVGGDSTGCSGDTPAGGGVGRGTDATGGGGIGGGMRGGTSGAAVNAGGASDGGTNEESAPGAGGCAMPGIAMTGAASGGNGGRALTPADSGTAGRADSPRSGSGSSGGEDSGSSDSGTGNTAATTGTGGPAVKAGVPLPRCAPAMNIEVNSPGAAVGVVIGRAAAGGAGGG